IAPEQRPVRVGYLPRGFNRGGPSHSLSGVIFSGQGEIPSLQEIKQAFQNQLQTLYRAETSLGTTLLGPHRDDWLIYLEEEPLKVRGSQGEIRSALLALKLSEIELFTERTAMRPLLLLDDFSSELDEHRRSHL